jgi:hypothetical protein
MEEEGGWGAIETKETGAEVAGKDTSGRRFCSGVCSLLSPVPRLVAPVGWHATCCHRLPCLDASIAWALLCALKRARELGTIDWRRRRRGGDNGLGSGHRSRFGYDIFTKYDLWDLVFHGTHQNKWCGDAELAVSHKRHRLMDGAHVMDVYFHPRSEQAEGKI